MSRNFLDICVLVLALYTAISTCLPSFNEIVLPKKRNSDLRTIFLGIKSFSMSIDITTDRKEECVNVGDELPPSKHEYPDQITIPKNTKCWVFADAGCLLDGGVAPSPYETKDYVLVVKFLNPDDCKSFKCTF
ncbi:hypothetical protein LTR05_008458 [Lithohypha guttulata]|uniref:Uncharacterized protein n=1 Tax=Lithohypha guttulata TaxID=1690604 RepID=A0AAN7PJX7_9EURO|nr:hypothetical protein LTR05_008458 [Lithohypha guttulata]